jgi:hypothetical protein
MRSILTAAAAVGLLASTSAYAATAEVAVTANVTSACGVGNHISGASSAPGWTQGAITISGLADGNGQYNGGLEVTNRNLGNVWCNGPANVKLEVSKLTNSTTVSDTSSFTNNFDVEVNTDMVAYVGGSSTITTVGAAGGVAARSAATTGAFETGLQKYGGFNSLKVLPAVRSSGGNLRPIAGTYNGFVRFTATAI